MSNFLKRKFLRICPYGKKYLDKLTAACMRDMTLLAGFAVVVVLLWNSMFAKFSLLYLLESVILSGYLVCMEVPAYQLQERENRIYRELLIYLSRVKHRYTACHHIANAVLDASENMSYEIQRLAGEIYRVLMECNRKEKVREYILYHHANRYIKLFLIQAYEASEKGGMFFSENVEHLRLEVMEEFYRRKRRAHEFAGYVFVAVTPFFMMPVLKQWGLEFAPELKVFYAGIGALLETVTFGFTLIIYDWIVRVKEIAFFSDEPEKEEGMVTSFYKDRKVAFILHQLEQAKGKISNAIRNLIVQSGEKTSYGRVCFKMVFIAGCSLVILTAFCVDIHRRERKAILEEVESIETIAPVANEEKKSILAGHILNITRQCIAENCVMEEEICILLREKVRLGNETMERAAVKEIATKVKQYEKAKISILEIFFCILGSLCMGLLPVIRLIFQVKSARAGVAYEVRQFQSIILMERRLQGITIVNLLEDMEVFSRCFKNVLRRCINSYGAGSEKALLRLKEEGKQLHEGFEELADAFLSVDEIGIELAFAEVESNRKLLEKMSQLEAEISMERKKDSTDLVAKIPMALAVGSYFILPFFMHSLQGVKEIFDLLEGIPT